MTLWLDGGFWGPWIQQAYPAEVDALREALLTHMLPALPDPAREAETYQQAQWEWAMSQPSDGTDDPSKWVEWAQEQGMERYERLAGVQQAMLNMGTVMLWHLMEQQMLSFHRRQVLSIHEEAAALNDPKLRQRLCTLKEFEDRMAEGGYALGQLANWAKVSELRLVANTVKHGAGDSACRLYLLRPDLFSPPGLDQPSQGMSPRLGRVERPASGDDLYVTEQDLVSYFDAAAAFWQEFGTLVEG